MTEIRSFTPEEQARWDAWLAAEIKKLALDPDSAINTVIAAHCEALLQRLEKEMPAFVAQQLDALRAELTEQQDEREKTWLQKLMTW